MMITVPDFPGSADENHLHSALSTLHPHGPHFRVNSFSVLAVEGVVLLFLLCIDSGTNAGERLSNFPKHF